MSNLIIQNSSESAKELFSSDEPPSSKSLLSKFNASEKQWNDWKWQLKNCIRSFAHLKKIFPEFIHDEENDIPFKMAITPYYLSISKDWPNSIVAKMFLPHKDEMINNSHCSEDPLNEEHQMPVPNLVHRYADRALVITTTFCGNFCRYCTRKRSVGYNDSSLSTENLIQIVNYISNHPEIKDVILSGGDFLTLSNDKIKHILTAIDSIETVDIIRIGSKVPVVLPQRMNDSQLIKILKSVKKPLYINTHFNHQDEVTEESSRACLTLANAGIILGNQSVLLKEINDNTEVLAELYRSLLKIKVKPYYIYCCDQINGTEHFRVKFQDCVNIVDGLRGKISGLGIPTLILDSPNGLGKINVSKNNVISMNDEKVTLRNFEGKEVVYWN